MTMTVVSDERADPADEKTEPADESTSAADESDTASDATDTAPEADEQAPATDADADTDEGERRPRSWLRRVLVGAVAVVFVAALAGSGVLGWMLWQDREVTRAGEQAQQAAVAYAQTLTSIDSNKVDENFNQVLDGATGEFKDMYSQSSAQLRQLLIDNKAVSHGTVVDAAIKSATKDKVEVLIFVDQSISNSLNPEPRIDRSRVTMTMELIDNHWLVSNVEIN